MDNKVRLQKYIADCGLCSRRAAEALIEKGSVTINDKPARLGDKITPGHAVVKVDGRVFKGYTSPKAYFMLYKPRGYITAAKDKDGRKCVNDIVKRERVRLYPVGRLDKDSEGLVIMTNDGALANRLTHPKNHVPKTYRTIVGGKVDKSQILALQNGVFIEKDGYTTAPAKVEILEQRDDRCIMYITIYEGKNRQIRNMCEAVGLEVMRLKREKIGTLSIGTLRQGQYRALTQKEIKYLESL